MDKTSTEIQSFIDRLAFRESYGLRGERPMAVIAVLKYAAKNGIVGKTLLMFLEDRRHKNKVKDEFLRLAKEFGRIENPEGSWSRMIEQKVLLRDVIHLSPRADKNFRYLTIQDIRSLYDDCIKLLKEDRERIMP